MPNITNRLARATSPYLLQHAHNPVDWFEWGKEALTKAKNEDKPILVSIGYSSCHWCHVMERESFENEEIARIMNENFVCIKVDREERPDIDHIYMEAVQAMQQHGGWPLNVFLTPEQKPFYGGTYFPPNNWSQLLLQVSKAFKFKRDGINQSSEELRQHLQTNDLKRFAREPGMEKFKTESLDKMFEILTTRFDSTWGGIEKAPKFVMPSIWLFLLRYFSVTKRQEALDMVRLTLEKISMGGIYDQLGGGFSRYSVDGEWFAPHFEKMLYDNAQLLSLYAEAYSISKNNDFKRIIYETVRWLEREMTHPDGGFYSALDADSEGEEGKFYTWTWTELMTSVEKHDVTPEYFNATKNGNWEHGRNILIRTGNDSALMNDFNINAHDLEVLVNEGKKKLLAARSQRIRPSLDDKILLGWNAMMIQGLTDAYKFTGDSMFLQRALKCISFLESHMMDGEKVYRAFKNKRSGTEGFLEDYAFLIQAYISLYESTFKETWLEKARHWCEYVIIHFYDESDGFFQFSSNGAEQLIASKKEIFDNVIPSSNAVMARNLYQLGIMLGRDDWKQMGTDMVSRIASLIESEPGYLCHWGIAFSEITHGLSEIVVVGKEAQQRKNELNQHYLPFARILGTESSSTLPLFEGREARDEKTMIYVCFNKTCELPVNKTDEALDQLSR